jgi:hypothetical protein
METGGYARGEVLTIAEIRTRFISEWILLVDPDKNSLGLVHACRVAYHSKDRDEMYQRALESRPQRCAFLYTGTIPKGTAVIL